MHTGRPKAMVYRRASLYAAVGTHREIRIENVNPGAIIGFDVVNITLVHRGVGRNVYSSVNLVAFFVKIKGKAQVTKSVRSGLCF